VSDIKQILKKTPQSTLDAILQEFEVFHNSIVKLREEIITLVSNLDIRDAVSEATDELEAVMNNSIALAPDAVERANAAISKIKKLCRVIDSTDPSEIYNIIERLTSQAKYIEARISNLMKLSLEMGDITSPAQSIIIAQEQERKRISREIHDGPAQIFASLIMSIDFCLSMRGVTKEVAEELNLVKKSLNKNLNEIRRLIFDLRPMSLDDLGIIPTLERYISHFKAKTKASVYFDVKGNRVSFESIDTELAIFRVIQEALNNAFYHGEPDKICIALMYKPEANLFEATISDDGKGFNPDAMVANYASKQKLGLLSMQERIALNGGHLKIDSAPGKGTVVYFTLPFIRRSNV